jgi:hypothetical protein
MRAASAQMSSVEPMDDVEPMSKNHALALTIDLSFRMLQYRVEDDVSSRVMAVMAKAIERSQKICDEASRRGDEDYAEIICGGEIDYIEELLGISFVLRARQRRHSRAAVLRLSSVAAFAPLYDYNEFVMSTVLGE